MNGWMRLGIVLSVCWAVFVGTLTAYEYFRFPLEPSGAYEDRPEPQVYEQAKKFYLVVVKETTGLKALSPDQREGLERLIRESQTDQDRSMRIALRDSVYYYSSGINWPLFLAVLFLPVALGWFIVYALRFAVRWVSQGFRDEQRPNP